jgi:hypothetical protein
VDERKPYQTYLGPKNSIQEYTLGPELARDMRYAHELAPKELFQLPRSGRSRKRSPRLARKTIGRQDWRKRTRKTSPHPPAFQRTVKDIAKTLIVVYGGQASVIFLPFLSGLSAETTTFSKDGQWITYLTYPRAGRPPGHRTCELDALPS